MLRRLIGFSLSQRLLVLLGALAIVGAGVWAYLKLPIDAYPNIAPTQVKLILKAPGMTPEEVETRVVVPLEMELLGIPHAQMLRSMSKYAIADITLDFDEGTDIYWARQQVSERFAAAAGELPGDVSGGLAPIATPLSDMFMFTIEGGGLSLAERRTLLDWTIRPALRTIPGVADLNALGGKVRTFLVTPDRARLSAAGLHFRDVADAVMRNNRNDGSGRLRDGDETLIVRAEGAVRTLDDLRRVVVATRDGTLLRVDDLAQVRYGSLTRYGAVTRDGAGEAVEGLVVGLRGADASKVVDAVRARLDSLQSALPEGARIEVFYDRGALIERAVDTVRSALIEATVLVVILLLLFLGDVRAAVVVSLTLPLAVLIAFLMMHVFGLSANLMSLGGLAIAIGLLVDAAVVVVENTVSHLVPGRNASELPKLHRVYRSVAEVARPVVSGIAIICLVFMPLLTLQGLEGKLFGPVALTIIFALAASLLLSMTVVPVLCSMLLRERPHKEPWLMRQIERGYRPLLEWSLAHARWMGVIAGVALAVGVVAYMATGKTFMPTMDEGDVLMQLTKPPSISLEASRDQDLAIERAIKQRVPEVEHVVARLGSDELGLDPMSLNETDMFLQLKPKDRWRVPDKNWLEDQLRAVMKDFPGIEYGFTQPIQMRVSEMLTGSRGDIAVKVFGPDLATLNQIANRIAAMLEKTPGSQDVIAQTQEGVRYLGVRIDRQAAGRYGLDVAAVQDELRGQLEGMRAGNVLEQQRRVPILVRGEARMADTQELFERMNLATTDGMQVPLERIAALEATTGPMQIRRENGSRFALVQSNVAGRDLVGFVDEVRAAVERDIHLPTGYRVTWGGQFENQQRAAARLALVVPVSLALIFLVLFSTFGSIRQAVLILCNVPFALVGGIVALWLSGQYLSVPASVGFIALLGIAVLNGLVLVSYFNQLRAAGMSMDEVVREGAIRRLRPVMMTASIAALGLVPLLFASGPGSEVQKPLAVVVIGGLVTCTALTLLLLPTLFRRFGESRRVEE
ncbi:efflux RND transporter permease subunit [Oleiagrimonas soli]|uniref:Cobalt-zinc-cadmium resistance protein CzcA n=1 Tax=Oleiagrimonas soli TaxID=1543381 RepID=A0A099CSC0_9GAMM|nr:CusA/CzcA family heavy metal efflux RND transporter [Oleiagrimonas soli]KGI76679.1 cytochrome C peroxidase [Oleiagrimonas soli]MBB6185106.1 cobalt-zinc-cadmium resistance protein CzcA [Oleiagrimonas soli]